MSKISKWKLEKTKVKVVFRLQFHATHIPQSGWDKLFISCIPADSGKATAKTTKANVRNGTCKWADPIYETTRLLQDAKSKQFDEKLYKLVVAMGSSRASVLGEAVINLAEYADAVKPSVVGLPLHGCNFGTTLHVTVQLLTSKTGFREFEQQREQRDKGFQSGDKHDGSSPGKAAYLQEIAADTMDKVHPRVRYASDARELSSVEEDVGNEEYSESGVGFGGSSNTSESLYTEKHDTPINSEIDSLKGKVSGDINGVIRKGDPPDNQIMNSGSIDPVHRWSSEYSTDNDLAIACEENNKLRGDLDLAASSVFELQLEVSSLQSQAEELSTETDRYSGILASEISSCKELAKEVSHLKAECFHCKDDIERLKDIKSSHQLTGEEHVHVDLHHLLQNIQLRWTSGIRIIEDRTRELQSKTYVAFHERDSRFLHSELDVLLHSLQDLKQGTEEALSFLNVTSPKRSDVNDRTEISSRQDKNFGSETGMEIEVCEPEIMLQHLTCPPVVSQVNDSHSDIDAMKKNLFDLVKELDGAKVEREGLVRKMGQMECYYEALVQELEETQKQLMGELQNIRNEHSTCLYELSTSKVEMESMRQDMTRQVLQLSDERCGLDALNKELERRAATSDAALRRARLNYSIAVDKLQKDLELLSSQVVSMFETNETLIKQAFSEPPSLLNFGSADAVRNSEDSDAIKLLRFPSQNASPMKQQGREIFLEDLKRSLSVQEDLYHKVEEELMDMHSVNLQLDIFSRALTETLSEASSGLRHLRAQTEDLENQLKVSDEFKNILVARLQAAMDDVNNLREYNARCNAHYNDAALQNQILEARLESILKENSLLLKEVEDQEAVILQCKSYQSQYETCLDEKSELSDLLVQETWLTSKRQDEISTLNEELETLKTNFFELNNLRENLEETVSFVQKKLLSLSASYDKQLTGLSLRNNAYTLDLKSMDCKGALSLLEDMQHNACSKILELMDENKKLDNEKLSADISLNAARSEFLDMEKKFKSNIQDIMTMFDASNAIVDNFGVKLEDVSNKLIQSSAAGERHVQKHSELLDHLVILEAELQNLFCKDGHLLQEISCLDSVAMELETSKLTIGGLMQEKQELVTSLLDRNAESVKLSSEFCSLKENLRTLQVELEAERDGRNNLQSKIGDLTSQLNMDQSKLRDISLQNFELLHYQQHATNLELENSRVKDLLLQRDDLVEKLLSESCSASALDTQLSEMLEYVVNADVKSSFFTSLYQAMIEELEQKLICLDAGYKELHKRHEEVETMLNCSLAKESDYISELSKVENLMESTRSELENSLAQNTVLLETNETVVIQLSEYKRRMENLEVSNSEDKDLHMFEKKKWKKDLACAEEEIISLTLLKEQMEILMLGLKYKTQEWNSCKKLLEENEKELLESRAQCIELANSKDDLARANDNIMVELNKHKEQMEALEVKITEDKYRNTVDAQGCKYSLASAEEEIFILTLSKELLEISMVELYDRLQELHSRTSLLQENGKELMTLRAQFFGLSDEYRNLARVNEVIQSDLSGCTKKLEAMEVSMSLHKDQHLNEAETWKNSLANAEEEIVDLTVSKHLLEITIEELNEKLQELHVSTKLLGECEKELMTLRSHCSDLSIKKSTLQSDNDGIRTAHDVYKSKLEALEVRISEDKGQVTNEAEELINSLETAEKEIISLTFMCEILKSSMTDLQDKLQKQCASSSLMKGEELMSLHKNCMGLSEWKAFAEEEITSLTLSTEQSEITIIVLKEKLHELVACTSSLEECEDQLMALRSRCTELSRKLSEQTLKTEEYKNLSIHLKELQEKAVTESQAAREKREPSAMQESLRIAFIKEQYETKLHELKQQLSISKKHGEEMLLKLQDTVDEIENRKRSEALHSRRNEELALKLLGLEDELQSMLSDNRERIKAYDRMKAEFECAALSLECCKEEKELLEISLRECEDEKSTILDELSMTKKHLENVVSSLNYKKEGPPKHDVLCPPNESSDTYRFREEVESPSSDPNLENDVSDIAAEAQAIQEDAACRDLNCQFSGFQLSNLENDVSDIAAEAQAIQEDAACRDLNGFAEPQAIERDLQHSNGDHVSCHFGSQDLKSSLMHLHDELEKMKKETFVIPEDQKFGSELLEKDILRLDKANEELRSVLPLDAEISSTGNALERVLTLEVELAETLRAKYKSKTDLQSQHGDEEAVLKSFRDINELIKEMLQLKGKNAAVEAELREMHDRYSQLSLQFAEVEGDRQKLKMTLKNIRASKKLMQLNRSSSAVNAEVSS